MGEEAVGALVEWVLGVVQHDDILLELQPYLGVRGALPVLLLLLLGLGHHRQRYVSGKSALFRLLVAVGKVTTSALLSLM